MPDFNRRQRSATCGTCKGALRFYPKPLADEAAMVAETDTAGEWSHLNPADWVTNPHQPDPQENSDNSDA